MTALPLADPEALARRLRGRPGLFLLDVDGTLAPIAPRPEDARVPAETLAVLARLVAAPDTAVALVSGRAPDDARRIVPIPGLWAIGNHGAELLTPDGAHEVDPEVAPWGAALADAAGALGPLTAVPGVILQDKRWSVSLHWRLAAPDVVPQLRAAAAEVAARRGLRLEEGKAVFEFKVPADVDKGTAILDLAERVGADARGAALFFAGDDVTDEDGFRRLRSAVPTAVTVRVGPPDAPTAAESVVPDPAAVRDLLAHLAAARGG